MSGKTGGVAKCPPGCIHQGRWCEGVKYCAYILDTGRRRPCPAGQNCTEYKRGRRKRKDPDVWED